MHIHENLIVEIVDPKTGKNVSPGEMGEIVVTALDDDAFPLIRMGTGDLTSITYEPCPCGRTSPRMTRVLGRVGESVRTRGMFIHPQQVEQALAQFPEISKYQGVVTRPGYRDEFILEAELKTEEGINKEELAKRLSKAVSEAVRLKLDRVEFIARGVIPEEHKLVIDRRVY
jgi:phenylacetate-CoA ligase